MENDVAVMKAAEEDAGDNKYMSDRCKVSIENKAIIDRYLLDGADVGSIDSLQICGLEVFFVNTTLEERGLYISTQFHHHSITKSLNNLKRYTGLALELLCFRDSCIATSNTYENMLIQLKDNKRNGKRPADIVQDSNLTLKQESIGGTWNSPRSTRTPPPEMPNNLWKV